MTWGLDAWASNQAAPEVTVNAGFARLGAGAPPVVLRSVTTTAPPADPAELALWGVPAGATGAWAGQGGKLARRYLAAWEFFDPPDLLRAFVADEAREAVWSAQAAAWLRGAVVSPLGAAVGLVLREVALTGLSGASATAPALLKDRDVVLGVSSRTAAAITGATSYSVGDAGDAVRYGDALGVALNASNVGVIGPRAIYADEDVVVTAAGGAFTGGAVTLSAMVLAGAAALAT